MRRVNVEAVIGLVGLTHRDLDAVAVLDLRAVFWDWDVLLRWWRIVRLRHWQRLHIGITPVRLREVVRLQASMRLNDRSAVNNAGIGHTDEYISAGVVSPVRKF